MVWGARVAAPHAATGIYPRGMSDRRPDETELDPQRAAELLAAGEARMVDIRQPHEWEEGRIPGADLIPLEELPARAAEIDDGHPIIFMCRSGNRSAMATEAFVASGRAAFNLAGGIEAWVASGLEIDPADGAVARPRPDNS
jgi:rhodanese-related sulfurtransferase